MNNNILLMILPPPFFTFNSDLECESVWVVDEALDVKIGATVEDGNCSCTQAGIHRRIYQSSWEDFKESNILGDSYGTRI